MTIERLLFIWNSALGTSGSGCWITGDLVLTAHHVLFARGEPDDEKRGFELITREQARRGPQTWAQASCIWWDKDHDLALLRVTDPAMLGPFPGPVLWGALPPGLVVEKLDAFGFPQFRAAGFPGVIARNATRKDETAVGSMRDHGKPEDRRLGFEIKSAGPDDELRRSAQQNGASWWGGMSGGPVFSGDSLIAVVVGDDGAGLDQSVLEVVPIRLIVSDAAFRKHVVNAAEIEVVGLGAGARRTVWEPLLPHDAALAADWKLDRLAPFFQHILRRDDDGRQQPARLEELVEKILSKHGSFTVMVSGGQGSGKSTLLAIVHEALKRTGSSDFAPILVNLAPYYDSWTTGSSDMQVRLTIRNDFDEFVSARSGPPYLFVVDGLAWDNPFIEEVLGQIALIHASRIRGLVLAAGENLGPRIARALDSSRLRAQSLTYRLVTAALDEPDALAFFRNFIEFFRHLRGQEVFTTEAEAERLLERARKLAFEPLDAHLLGMIFASLDDERYDDIRSGARFLERYCRERLPSAKKNPRNKEASNRELAYVAALAFDLVNAPADQPVSPARASVFEDRALQNAARSLVHEHANIRDFLAAWHIIELLRRARKEKDARATLVDKDFLKIDLPETINRFVKSIVNVDDQTLDDVFQAVKALHKEASSRTRHFFYYLLGRFESKAAEGPVKTFLNAVKDELTKELGDDVVRPERILRQAQVRTVFISLIYLGDQDALANYIRRLLEDQEAASVNRGFHRIYYGDVTADSVAGGERYLDDESGAWDRSRAALEARIERALSDSRLSDNDVLFEIRLFTLISFVQSRSGRGLDEAGAARLKEVIGKSLERIENEELAAYIRSFCIDLERRSFAPWDFIIDLYALKTARRQGWLDRGLPAPGGISTESVADHTYLACLLAWFLLPERDGEYPAYSKSRIVELLLMHDLAEAFIGDQVVVQMDAAKRKRYVEEERGAMHYIRMKDTYPGIWGGNVGFERWQEFEKHGTHQPENINARIAKDIDRLENLIQLHLYAHALGAEKTERFRQDLVEKIETDRLRGLASEFERWAQSRKTIEPQSSSFYRERLCSPSRA